MDVIKGRKVAIDIVKANVFAVVIMVVAAIVFLIPFFLIWKDRKPIGELFGGFGDWSIALVLMFVGIAVHELIHGATWACFAKNGWKSISFGIMWKLLTPYCHCNEPMHNPQLYVWSHDALYHSGSNPCHCCPVHRQSAITRVGYLLHCRSRWRHLDDMAADRGESQEHGT